MAKGEIMKHIIYLQFLIKIVISIALISLQHGEPNLGHVIPKTTCIHADYKNDVPFDVLHVIKYKQTLLSQTTNDILNTYKKLGNCVLVKRPCCFFTDYLFAPLRAPPQHYC